MYKAFYGLTKDPFPKGVEIKDFFKSKEFTEALNRLEFLKNTKGFGLITGELTQFLKNLILDDLRIIFNFEMDSKDYAILVLVGQVPFITQLNRQPHEALRQRIVINYNLQGLTKDEVKDYIVFSLKNVGCSEPIFTDDAFKLLFSSTNGFLRKINRLAKMCLIAGASQKLKSINSEIVFRAQSEINITAK
jgi:hypothetical protein